MAIFNPNVPETQPGHYRESRPTDFEADVSKGVALKAIGETLSSGVKVADQAVKTYLSENIRDDLEAERSAYTNALAFRKDVATGRINPLAETEEVDIDPISGRPATPGTPLNLLDKSRPLPQEVESLPRTLNVLQSARANGKISPTDFYARTDSVLSSYRTRFSGYRDYIDGVASSILGVDPANAYMRSLMSDLNSMQESGTAERNKIISKILAFDGPDQPRIYQDYVSGKINDVDALKHINKFEVQKYTYDQELKNLQVRTARTASNKVDSEEFANSTATQEADNMFYIQEARAGKKVSDLVEEAKTRTISTVEALDYTKSIQNMKNTYEQSARKKLAGVPHLSADEKNTIVAKGGAIFDSAIKLVGGKEFAALDFARAYSDAVVNQTKYGLINRKGLGESLVLMDVVKDYGPEVSSVVFGKLMTGTFVPELKAFVGQGMLEFTTQPAAANGGINTVAGKMDELYSKIDTDLPEVNHQLTEIVKLIPNANANPEARINAAKSLFSRPDLIRKFQENSQFDLYDKLTSDEVTKSMFDLGKLDPSVWQMYKDWNQQTFGFTLLRNTVKDLSNLQNTTAVELEWDTDFHQWKPYSVRRDQKVSPYVQRTIDKVNRALTSLAGIAKHDPSLDVDYFLLEEMEKYGFELNVNKVPQGIPEQMVQAVVNKINARKAAQKEAEETFKKKK